MQNAIIIGAGTYGQVYAEYLKVSYDIIGYIDDNESLIGNKLNGIEVLGNRDFLFQNMDKNIAVFVPIGDNNARVELLQKIIDSGFYTPSFIHPQACIHDNVTIGKAVYILPCTNIMPHTILKDYIMVSAGVTIAHHNVIENGCFFSQGSNIGASIHIQTGAYIGIGSTIATGVKSIGRNSLIGAGAVVTKDVSDNVIVVGMPTKILRYKEGVSSMCY